MEKPSFWHRVKSFFINYFSLIAGTVVTAFVAVLVSPEGQQIVTDVISKAPGYLIGIGVTGFIARLVGLTLSELWRDFLNRRKLDKIAKNGRFGSSGPIEFY